MALADALKKGGVVPSDQGTFENLQIVVGAKPPL